MPTARPRRRPQTAAASLHLPLDPTLFAPSPQRPVLARMKWLDDAARVVPHSHPWAQLVFSTTGVVRLTAADHSFLVPAARVVWIPAGVQHCVTVLQRARICTLYLLESVPGAGPRALSGAKPGPSDARWRRPLVLDLSPLLLELASSLACAPLERQPDTREGHLAALVGDELARARTLALGVALPQDKRLRRFCEAILDDPVRHRRLDQWAPQAGASPRTLARLFRAELGTTFGAWRRQALLERALSLGAQRKPLGHIAAELGYASPSAFSAMVRRTVGVAPRELLRGQPLPSGPARNALA